MTQNKNWKKMVRAVKAEMGWSYTRARLFCEDMAAVARAAPGDTTQALVALAKKAHDPGKPDDPS